MRESSKGLCIDGCNKRSQIMSSESIIRDKGELGLAFEFNKLKFASHPSDSFRLKASSGAGSRAVSLWVENVRTKEQWQATVAKISDCGPTGIPDDVVYSLFERALELLESSERVEDEPRMTLHISEANLVLTLHMVFGRIWKPEFVFTLLPVGLDRVDVLEAHLRDAQEEIEMLRAGAVASYLSLTSKSQCNFNNIVKWDGDKSFVTASHFKLSPDLTQVTILKEGVYQVNIALSGGNDANEQFSSLQLNSSDIVVSFQCESNYHKNTVQLHTIERFKEGDILQVKSGLEIHSTPTLAGNSMTILYLSL